MKAFIISMPDEVFDDLKKQFDTHVLGQPYIEPTAYIRELLYVEEGRMSFDERDNIKISVEEVSAQ